MLQSSISKKNLTNLNNIDTGKTVSNFNYNNWTDRTKVYLKNVPFQVTPSYEHVLHFEDEEKKKNYYLSESPIDVMGNIDYKLSIQLPYTIEQLSGYNYLIADSTQPTDLPYNEVYISTYYYFIVALEKKASNTTEVTLELDVYTTFINTINIKKMNLFKGHLPHKLSNVDSYLSDPINNNSLLLESDIQPNKDIVVATKEMTLFNRGQQILVMMFSSPIGGDWNNQVAPHNGARGVYKIPNNSYTIGIKVEDYDKFFTAMTTNRPHMLQTLIQMCVVSEELISWGKDVSIWDTTVKYVLSSEIKQKDITLTKDKFKYPDEYKNFAKLYTSQYSSITISNGRQEMTLNIEEFSSAIKLWQRNSIDFPYLSIQTYISGYGGQGSQSLEVAEFTETKTKEFFNDKWSETILEHEVPMFGVFQRNTEQYHAIQDKVDTVRYDNILQDRDNEILNTNTLFNNNLNNINTTYNNSSRSINSNETISLINKEQQQFLTDEEIKKNKTLSYHNMYITNKQLENNVYVEDQKRNLKFGSANTGITTDIGSAVGNGGAVGGVGGLVSGILNVSSGLVGYSYALVEAEGVYETAFISIGLNNLLSVSEQFKMNGSDRADIFSAGSSTVTVLPDDGILGEYSRTVNNRLIDDAQDTIDINKNTSTSNILDTKNTEIGNVTDMNVTSTGIINNNYNMQKNELDANIESENLRNNILRGNHSSNVIEHMYGTTRHEFNFNRLSDSDTKLVGDNFTLYGYSLNQMVDVEKLDIMPHFTYWEGNILQADYRGIPYNWCMTFKEIFRRGVTIWTSDPNLIDIYDNNKEEE